jgi:predicted DNA-binding transcriptional regulator AlpA
MSLKENIKKTGPNRPESAKIAGVGGHPKLADSFSYPPRAMRSERAAAYLSMSESNFLRLVKEGKLPKAKKLDGIVFWDRGALDSFVENYEGEVDETIDKWDKILGDRK